MTKVSQHALALVATLLVAGAPAEAQVDFSHFHTPAEVDSILQKFVQDHPNLASVRSIGKSIENRDINALRISGTPQTGFPKAQVVFVGLHHAEEWITVEMELFSGRPNPLALRN